jgi:membrane-bound lytic murein transglycosylase A
MVSLGLATLLMYLAPVPLSEARSPAAATGGWTVETKPSEPKPSEPKPSETGSIEMPARPAPSGKTNPGKPKRPAAVMTARTRTSGIEFEPFSFELLPDWANDDHLAALKTFQASCPQVIAGKAGRSTAAGAPELASACTAAMALPAKMTRVAARGFIEAHFRPHRVVHAGTEGLVTGYYEPVIEGSRTPQGKFRTPLFKRPPDLVGTVRKTGDGLVPFSTRAEIEAGALAGRNLELLYLASPVDKYFLQIQGAGRIRLTDGTEVRVQYDGKNGHPYTSIGRYLIEKGLIAADKMSMGALGRWLKANPARGQEAMNQNASYVFFKEMPADARGPRGAFDVTLVAGRSLAVDPAVHRLGGFVYVSAPSLTPKGHSRPFNRLMVAHDVGGAIKGPERADIYFGTGEQAESQAGGVRHPGNLFALLPVSSAAVPGGPAGVPARR